MARELTWDPPLTAIWRSGARLLLAPVSSTPDLSLIVPIRNQRDNVAALVEGLRRALDGITWEAIFVDNHSLPRWNAGGSGLRRAGRPGAQPPTLRPGPVVAPCRIPLRLCDTLPRPLLLGPPRQNSPFASASRNTRSTRAL